MADDNATLIAALKGQDAAAMQPETFANPAVASMLGQLATLPQRAIENSQHSLNTGTYDPAVPMEAAMSLAGAGLPMAEEGAAGIFGGKLAKTANLDKLAQANRMVNKGVDRGMARQITGWHQGPDGEWRFEIPDERSRMMYPNAGGPAGTLFQHDELYKAYPGLQNVQMHSEINPNFPSDTGGWNLGTGLMQMSSRNPGQARLGALHEMQHAVQHIEGFTPGTTQEAYQEALKLAPEHLRKAAGDVDPWDMYQRTAGEVEARNVEQRADFNPRARYDIHPWETQEYPYEKQLRVPAVTGTDYEPLLRALRGGQ